MKKGTSSQSKPQTYHVRMRWKLKDALDGVTNLFRHVAVLGVFVPHSENILAVSDANHRTANLSLGNSRKLTSNQGKQHWTIQKSDYNF
jgi:hypothetical protein